MRSLNSRQKLFLRSMIDHGFFDAVKIAGYTRRHGYRILKDPKAEVYLVSIVKNTIDELNLTHAELIRKRLELADDSETPARVRSDIYKDLAEMVERIESSAGDNGELPRVFNGKPFLKPARSFKEETE